MSSWLAGFGIMFAGDGALHRRAATSFILGDYSSTFPSWAFVIFQTVFCATAATIVSGAMAERTKFLSYCIYSVAISLIVYPVGGHWVWGGGWLSQLGFHDFAGSTAVHMVGGLCALIGAKMVGPRIGKYDEGRQGERHPGPQPHISAALGCLYPVVLLVRLQRLLHRFDDRGRRRFGRTPASSSSIPTWPQLWQRLCGDDHYLEPLQKARRLDDAERFSGRTCGHHGRLRRSGRRSARPFIGLIAGFRSGVRR